MNFDPKKIAQKRISKLPNVNFNSIAAKFNTISLWLIITSAALVTVSSFNFHKEVYRHRSSYFISSTGKTTQLLYDADVENKIHQQMTISNNYEKEKQQQNPVH